MVCLVISSNCGSELPELDLSKLECLQSIEIGSECFQSVQTFTIDGLHRLKSLKIISNSFTKETNSYSRDESKSFHILNCESLESIQIKEYSFSDFSGDFELKNLESLQSIRIGNMENESYNFWYSSFVVRRIAMILKSEAYISLSYSSLHWAIVCLRTASLQKWNVLNCHDTCDLNRSSIITIHSTRKICALWKL